MRRSTLSLIAVWLLVPVASLSAQQPLHLERGARVRVTHTCASQRGQDPVCSGHSRRDVGKYRSIRDDTLRYELKNPFRRIKIPLEGVRLIEVVQGQKSRWLSGMGSGTVIGAFCGIAIGLAVYDYEPNPWVPNMGPAYGVAIGAPVGLIVGAIIGSFIKDEEWEEVPLDRVRVSIAPQRDGFAFGLTVNF